MKINTLIWLNTVVAILGTYLNAKQNRLGFILWMITNAVFIVYNFYLKAYPQVGLFSVYFFLAVYGWVSWGIRAKRQKA